VNDPTEVAALCVSRVAECRDVVGPARGASREPEVRRCSQSAVRETDRSLDSGE
jgi:hypothetical protein